MTKKILDKDLLTSNYIFFQFRNAIKIIKNNFSMSSNQFNKISNLLYSYINISVFKKLYQFAKN